MCIKSGLKILPCLKILRCIMFFFALLLTGGAKGGTLTETIRNLNIPVIEINTIDGEEPTYRDTTDGTFTTITGNEYVKGEMKVSLQNELLYESGEYVKNKSGVKIRVRGNTSAIGYQQKPYKIKLEEASDLMGMLTGEAYLPETEFLLLHARLTTVVGFKMSEIVGMEWTPKYTFVNVFLNGRYRGIYLLVESVKKSPERVNISDDGFIVEYDAYWWKEEHYVKSVISSVYGWDLSYTFKYPNNNLTDEREKEVGGYINDVERRLVDQDRPFSGYIDYESFAKWLLVQDFIGNFDSFGSNVFLYREHFDTQNPYAGKLKIGPLWDFDNAYKTSGNWASIHNQFFYGARGSHYFLTYDLEFTDIYRELFWKYRLDMLNLVDGLREEYAEIEEDINLSEYYTAENCGGFMTKNFTLECERAEDWIEEREEWMRKKLEKENLKRMKISLYVGNKKTANEPFDVTIKRYDEHVWSSVRLDVVRMDGVLKESREVNSSQVTVSLPSGLYILVLYAGGQRTSVCKVIVE